MNNRVNRILLPLAAALWLSLAQAQAQNGSDTGVEPQAAETASQQAQTVRKLQAIKNALDDRREQVRNLLELLQSATESDQDRIREKIAIQQQRIRELSDSFEKTAVAGASLPAFDGDKKERFDWQAELVQIARPILDSLKDATAKPRRIAELQTSVDLYRQQLEVAARALDVLSRFRGTELPPEVAEGIEDITATWRRRKSEIELLLKADSEELRFLQSQETEFFETMGSTVYEFILGRGLTLLIALLAGLLVWYGMRTLRRLARGRPRGARQSSQAAQIRLLMYAYHLLSMVLITLAVLSVFYIRGDVLLLSLSIIALVMLALSLWRFLPGYVQEARLLLNAGAAREGERVDYNGLPFRIDSLNLHSELRNPELDGYLRLPLAALAQLNSHPPVSESWFPTSNGDYVLLPDGNFGQVLEQTVELVRLKVLSSQMQYRSADFMQLELKNLTRDGFGLAVVFGIDYEHQPIALEQVSARFEQGLRQAFDAAGYGDDLAGLLVDFKQAAASSLDYLVYASFDGARASSYFSIERLIQQSCVDICNREGWGIPFTQVTVHQAANDGADQARPA